ncbi:MAG: hypothetical protein ACPG7F_05720 [Aggregatilineales bacterium]
MALYPDHRAITITISVMEAAAMFPDKNRFNLLLLLGLLLLPATGLLAQDNPTVTATPIIVNTPVIGIQDNNTGTTTESGQPDLTGVIITTPIPVETTEEAVAPDAGEATVVPTAAPTATPPPETSNANQCPEQVDVAYSTLVNQCGGLETDQVCIGLGNVNAAPRTETPNFVFNSIGNRTRTSGLEFLQLQTFGGTDLNWTVVAGSWLLTAADSLPASATIIALGEVVITDQGETAVTEFPIGRIVADNGLVLRRRPDSAAESVIGLPPGDELIVTGRTDDQQWLRVERPLFGGVVWGFANFIELQSGSIASLPIVTEQSVAPTVAVPEYTSMQAIGFESAGGDLEACPEVPLSGMLIQSPAGILNGLAFKVNEVEFSLNGTTYLQAARGGDMLMSLIDGTLSVIQGGEVITVPVGAAATIAISTEQTVAGILRVEPFDQENLSRLPVNILPNPVVVGLPYVPPRPTDTPAEIAAQPTPTGVRAVGPSGNLDLDATDTPVPPPPQPGIVAPVPTATRGGVIVVGPSSNATVDANVPANATPAPVQVSTIQSALPTAVPAQVEPANLQSTEIAGNLCTMNTSASLSKSADNTDSPATTIGGTWTASSGVTVVFQGTNFNLTTPDPAYGDYLRLVSLDGNILAQSGGDTALAYTFPAATSFTLEFAAANGDFVVMTAECTG